MARKNKLLSWALFLIGIITSIGVGELFIRGDFLNTMILGFLPLLIHQIVGWGLIVTAVTGFIGKVSGRKIL